MGESSKTTLYVVVRTESAAHPPYVRVASKDVHYRESLAANQVAAFKSRGIYAHVQTEIVPARVWQVMCGTCGQEVDAMTRDGADAMHYDGAHFPSWYLEGDADRRMSDIVEGWE